MKNKKIKKIHLKLLFDIIMFFLLMLLYNKRVLSMLFHELGGLIVCGFFWRILL